LIGTLAEALYYIALARLMLYTTTAFGFHTATELAVRRGIAQGAPRVALRKQHYTIPRRCAMGTKGREWV